MKLARAALQARIPRYFPWQFGVDFAVIGRGSPQDTFDAQLDARELLPHHSRHRRGIVDHCKPYFGPQRVIVGPTI